MSPHQRHLLALHLDATRPPAAFAPDIATLQGMVGAAPVPLLLIDRLHRQQRVLFANPAFLAQTGFTHADLTDGFFALLGGKGTDQAAMALIGSLVALAAPGSAELMLYRRDGTSFWGHVSVAPVPAADGPARCVVASIHDISRCRDAETALDGARVDKLALFAGGIAHDLNNMLQLVFSHVDLLSARLALGGPTADSEGFQTLELLRGSAERAALLTRRLSALSGRQRPKARAVNLNTLVSNAILALEARGLAPPGLFDSRLDPGIASCCLDPVQAATTLRALLLRPCAMPGVGAAVLIETRGLDDQSRPAAADGATWVAVSIGAGPAGGAGPAWVAGDQLDDDDAESVLLMARDLALSGQGVMMVRRDVATGAIAGVCLSFPALGEGGTEAALTTHLPGGDEHVLVVDSSAEVLALTSGVLGSLGYQVSVAHSAIEALEQLERDHGIALLVSDLALPGMSGIVLARNARRQRAGLGVLLTTGYRQAAPDGHVGGFTVIAKPWRRPDLAYAVRGVLDKAY